MSDNALATLDVTSDLTTGGHSTYCSIQATDLASKAKVFNAMNNPDHRVGDFINKTIELRDVLAEVIEMDEKDENDQPVIDPETGEVRRIQAVRVVLFDSKGESYQAVSTGIYNAVKKLMLIYGAPTWEEPIKVEVKQISLGKNQMLTLNVVG